MFVAIALNSVEKNLAKNLTFQSKTSKKDLLLKKLKKKNSQDAQGFPIHPVHILSEFFFSEKS